MLDSIDLTHELIVMHYWVLVLVSMGISVYQKDETNTLVYCANKFTNNIIHYYYTNSTNVSYLTTGMVESTDIPKTPDTSTSEEMKCSVLIVIVGSTECIGEQKNNQSVHTCKAI